jgi:hypothetical protein
MNARNHPRAERCEVKTNPPIGDVRLHTNTMLELASPPKAKDKPNGNSKLNVS